MTELVQYELQGLQIEGLEGDKTVFVKVGPGEEQLIKIVNTGSPERKLTSVILSKKITNIEDDEDYKR